MKDLFSGHAPAYARFRPAYPPAMYVFLNSLIAYPERAWDCGTGNGQVAVALSDRFPEVVATDISESQLAEAPARDNIAYRKLSAEEADFPPAYFDLITVAQAAHWFALESFYESARRSLKPEGLLALIGYGLIESVEEPIDRQIRTLYQDTLGSYWEPERSHVDTHYRSLSFPFREMEAPRFTIEVDWTAERLAAYLQTWSAAQQYQQTHGEDAVAAFAQQLASSWGHQKTRRFRFPVFMRVGYLYL